MSTINTNAQAITTAMSLDRTQDLLSNSIEELSSGSSLLNPGTNPTALADSDTLGAENQRLSAASTNVQDTVSYAQTSDGYLSMMGDVLNRMSELTADSQDPTKNSTDIGNYEIEFKSLQDQLRNLIGGSSSAIGGQPVVPSATFNGSTLFGSTASGGLTVDVGDSSATQLTVPDINLQSGPMQALIQQDSSGNYALNSSSSGAAADIDSAIQQVADGRTVIGGVESRLTLTGASLATEQQNISSAISSMSDVDVAAASTQLAKYNILAQAGASMLAQANLQPQAVLKLIKS
jgi:flagellin